MSESKFSATTIEEIVRQALATLAWSESDSDGDNFDGAEYDEYEWSDAAKKIMTEIVERFTEENFADLGDLTAEQIGHDLILTANGHESGFFDFDLPDHGERLVQSALSVCPINMFTDAERIKPTGRLEFHLELENPEYVSPKRIRTRTDYMAERISHNDYYSQFVTNDTLREVNSEFGLEMLRENLAKDKNLNTIPLSEWNAVCFITEYRGRGDRFVAKIPFDRDVVEAAGELVTRATLVCIAKTAARILVESSNQSS